MDRPFESNLSKQRELNGSVDSWEKEVETHAASALYGVNVKIRIGNDQEFYQLTFSLFQQENCLTDIPYDHNIFLSLKDDHFSYLRKISDCRNSEQERDHWDRIDWFEMDCVNGKETLQKVECTQDICSDKGKSPRAKENKKVLKN